MAVGQFKPFVLMKLWEYILLAYCNPSFIDFATFFILDFVSVRKA